MSFDPRSFMTRSGSMFGTILCEPDWFSPGRLALYGSNMRLAILKERRGHRPRLQPRVPAELNVCKAQPLRGGEYRRLNPFDRHLVHHDVDDGTVTRFARLGLPNLADDVHSF